MRKYLPTGHEWGQWPDEAFCDIGNAAGFIGNFCRIFGRFTGQTKEKFGTARFYAMMYNNLDLYALYKGGYYYYRGPNWFWKINCVLAHNIQVPFNLLGRWQGFVYKLAYRIACFRWPHIYNEIISGADYPELLNIKPIKMEED